MDVAELIAEFVVLNAKAKNFELSADEFVRWTELKEELIEAIGREPGPSAQRPERELTVSR